MAHVVADKRVCASTRQCVSVAPDFFGVDPADGKVRILVDPIPAEDLDLVEEATETCPVQALLLAADR